MCVKLKHQTKHLNNVNESLNVKINHWVNKQVRLILTTQGCSKILARKFKFTGKISCVNVKLMKNSYLF
jgi:urease accessory protein UreH